MMTIHPLAPEDAPAVAALRQAASVHKGEPLGPEAPAYVRRHVRRSTCCGKCQG